MSTRSSRELDRSTGDLRVCDADKMRAVCGSSAPAGYSTPALPHRLINAPTPCASIPTGCDNSVPPNSSDIMRAGADVRSRSRSTRTSSASDARYGRAGLTPLAVAGPYRAGENRITSGAVKRAL